ncbi:unnamed protein product, partial [Candidula unifasciata]
DVVSNAQMGGNYKPNLSASSVPMLVQKVYGLSVIVVQELKSYDDQNFLVEEVPGSSLPSDSQFASSHRYVLKILNAFDSRKPAVAEIQTEVILHAKRADIPTPDVIPTTNGNYQLLLSLPKSGFEDAEMEKYVVRLFVFMPDETLDQVALSHQLCYEVGWLAGKLDSVLQDFSKAENSVIASMSRGWNMSHIPELRGKLHIVRCPEQRRIIGEIIDKFETSVLSAQDKFSKGLIHSDFNECNILVSQNFSSVPVKPSEVCRELEHTTSVDNNDVGATEQNFCLDQMQKNVAAKFKCRILTSDNAHSLDTKPWHVSGIIDFGDTTFSLYIFEVAIAIVYIMLNKHGVPAMEAASFFLSGYLQHISLTDFEIKHLKLCVCARFAQSLVLGYFSITSDPGNEYTLTHAERVWPVLKYLWDMPDELAFVQLMEQVTSKL